MTGFIHDNFILQGTTAQQLYHDYAAACPIIDYHNHLPPSDIADNKSYGSITELWLKEDHYKWRAMRACGVDESLITGDASDFDKFEAYASCVPKLLRNPLYHWTHLELKRYFDIDELLNGDNARIIYDACNLKLKQPDFTARGLLKMMNVKAVCTTDDPIDTLEYHRKMEDHELKMLPTFRPDKAIDIQSATFISYVHSLGDVLDMNITDFGQLVEALMIRIGYFHDNGCRISDHGMGQLPYGSFSRKAADKAMAAVLRGEEVSDAHAEDFKFTLMQLLCREYARRGWVQQFHLGVMRDNNTRLFKMLGNDTGCDSLGDFDHGIRMSNFFDTLDYHAGLTKTILYNLNPADNALFATMVGNYNDGKIAGKMQYGSGWWFLDQLDGMRHQLDTLSNMGVLSQFIGMLTDSRSLLSFPRHEYFRRLLCEMLGSDIDKGLIPKDLDLVGKMVSDICFDNARRFFEF